MELIKNLDSRRDKDGQMRRWGLFLCPYCKNGIEKRYSGGLRDKSCGCAKDKLIGKANSTHGCTREGCQTRLYTVWVSMKDRCCNSSNQAYKNYGGRGIKVCDEWLKFIPFKEWAKNNGYKDDLTIDRVKNNGNYKPSNCRWSTRKEQAHNKRNNKLTWAKVHLIRQVIHNNLCSRKELMEIYNISKSQIGKIVNNQCWTEVIYHGN